MALPKRYGIERGWPMGPGQLPVVAGDVPAGAILASYAPGYVRNQSGGYVLRSYT